MGPGPSDVPPRVLAALARPTIGHLDPAFVGMMDELKGLLRYAFQTENELTFPLSAPGSVGMESCFVNLVSPGDKVIVCINGVFGQRMAENVRRIGGVPVIVEDPWGDAVDPAKVEDTFRAHPDAAALAFVHAETSTGALSDAATLAAIARRFGALTIMDCVTSLAGVPVLLDEWGIDAAYSGSQKCLSCTPGLSPVSFSAAAVQRIRSRKTPCQSWFQDLSLVLGYWSGAKRTYHHTAPVNPLYGLHESLVLLAEEGLETSGNAIGTTIYAYGPVWKRWDYVLSCGKRRVCLNSTRFGFRMGLMKLLPVIACSPISGWRSVQGWEFWPARCGASA